MLAATQAAGVAVAAPAVPPCAISLHQHHEVKDMVIPTKNQIAQRIAELQPLRNKMSASMVDYLYLHAQKIAEIEAVREAKREARKVGGRAAPVPDPLPPMGVAAAVGLGKSHAVNDVAEAAYKAGLPVVILTPNHKLAQEYAQRLSHLKTTTTVYQGRREPAEGKPGGPPVDPGPHACYRLVQVSKAGDQNQRPARGLCSKCPNWFAAHLKSRDEIKRGRAEQFFQKTGIDPDTVPPCRFLIDGLPKQLSSQILIAPVQAFSEAMGILKGRDERGNIVQQTQRLVIVDEHIPLAQEVEIGAGDITVWRNRLEGLEDQIKQHIGALEKRASLSQSEMEDLQQLRESLPLLPEIDDIFKTLASKIAGDIELDQADVARIINLQKLSAKVGLSLAGTAAWEKVSYMPDEDDFFIPLRALSTLARNLEAGSARQEKGVLNVYETSPVLEWARREGSVMFLDATMSQTMRRFIEAQGGKVVEATAEQNMRVIRLTGNLYARGEVRKDDYPAKARERMGDVRQIAAQMDKPAAIITHKAYLKYSREQEACLADKAAEAAAQKFEEETGVPIGWFGKHDRGMNDWSARHIALVGMPLLSKEAIAGAYACTRAAMLDCGLAAPVWDGVMDKEKADANGPPMPVMPQVRAWLIDEYAQSVAQAVGRNRAVNHPRECGPLQVQIWGGLQGKEMNAAMARYGVRVQEMQRNPMSVSGPKVDAGAVDAAIEMVLATGGAVSERSVRAALVGLRRSASTESIRARLRELRANGAIPAATRVRGERAKSAEASPETVFAAPAHITEEAVPVEAVSVEPQPQTQKQGQEKNSGLPNIATAITTAPNSYKNTNNGNSAQSRDEEKPQTQGAKENFLAPVVAPRASAGAVPADEDTPGPIDGLTPREREMLDAMLAEIDELIASGELEIDPDDDPDPPQGPRGAPRRDPAPTGSHPPAAFLAPQYSLHTADGGWRSGMGEHSGEWESDPDPPPGPAFAACAHIKAEGSTGASSP